LKIFHPKNFLFFHFYSQKNTKRKILLWSFIVFSSTSLLFFRRLQFSTRNSAQKRFRYKKLECFPSICHKNCVCWASKASFMIHLTSSVVNESWGKSNNFLYVYFMGLLKSKKEKRKMERKIWKINKRSRKCCSANLDKFFV
jgi:hypothetical protein